MKSTRLGKIPHWRDGLDLLGAFGLALVFVPHWNNQEGGVELDTSRCFMGQARFSRLYTQLSPTLIVVGIDEHTALIFDFTTSTCSVSGRGGVTILRSGQEQQFRAGDKFLFQELGAYQVPDMQAGIATEIWEQVRKSSAPPSHRLQPPEAVLALAHQRQAARQSHNLEPGRPTA